VKFQFAFLIPIVIVVGLRRHVLGRSDDSRIAAGRDLRRVTRSIAAGFATYFLVVWPFGLYLYAPSSPAYSLWHRFVAASQAFPRLTVNAFNLWMNPLADVVVVNDRGLTDSRIIGDQTPVAAVGGLLLTPQLLGNLVFLAAVALALALVARRDDGETVTLAAFFIAAAFFVLPTQVHERYLFPALALGAVLFYRGRGWVALSVGFSAIMLLDLYWVYTLLPEWNRGMDRAPLLAATLLSPAGIYFVSATAVALFAGLARSTWQHARVASPTRVRG
jgi:hypothetical protein